jgi:uncharacterized repeat protein (TIGR01451 family)
VQTPALGATGSIQATLGSLESGLTATFELVVRVLPETAGATVVSNTAQVATASIDTNPDNNSATASATVNAPPDDIADLQVTKSDSPDPVLVGETVTYTVTVLNNGPDAAANVVLTDTLPAGVTFISATDGAVPVNGVLTYNVGALAAQQSRTVTIVVRADTPGQITNTASASADQDDPDSANNTGITATTDVLDPPETADTDVEVEKTAAATSVKPGAQIVYTIAVSNLGAADAADVVLRDLLPAHTRFVSFAAAAGWTVQQPQAGQTGAVSATLPNLAAGASATFELVVRLRPNTPLRTMVRNTAEVTIASDDINPDNDTATWNIAVRRAADRSSTFTLESRSTGYRNELGMFLVDDGSGRIGTLHPGDAGYAQAALARRRILFTAQDRPGIARTIDLPARSFFGLYLVQNSTSAAALANNPDNRLDNEPRVFFSFKAANPDGIEHLRWQGRAVFGYEDLTHGGDKDFNDLVVRISTKARHRSK